MVKTFTTVLAQTQKLKLTNKLKNNIKDKKEEEVKITTTKEKEFQNKRSKEMLQLPNKEPHKELLQL